MSENSSYFCFLSGKETFERKKVVVLQPKTGGAMNQLGILCFTSVARTQSFSATARELRITQQAVSKHIRTLEDELGFPLFLRSYQSVRLTKAGEQMLQYFEQREKLISGIHEHFRVGQENPPLRIAWSQWLGAPKWFRQSIVMFRHEHPDIRVSTYDLNAEEMANALKNEEIDILLTTQYAAGYLPVLWNITPIGKEPIFLVGSKRVNYNFDDCSLFPFFATYAGEFNEQGVLARVQKECERSNIYPKNIEICPNMGSVCLNVLVRSGLTLGVCIPPLVHSNEFVLRPTGQYASVVLCRPFRQKREESALFERFLLNRLGAVQ